MGSIAGQIAQDELGRFKPNRDPVSVFLDDFAGRLLARCYAADGDRVTMRLPNPGPTTRRRFSMQGIDVTGPGYDISYLVPLYSGQFGTDEMRSPMASPQFRPMLATTGQTVVGGTQFPTYFPFEFAKGYGVISGANAALLPVLQVNLAPISSVYTYTFTSAPTSTITVDSDFYWLPNVPADPPGIGTTCQWI